MTTPEIQQPAAPVVQVKTALAIAKKDYYAWLDEAYSYSKYSSHPVRGNDIHTAPLNEDNVVEFFQIPTALLVRPECEENEDFLQVLPYVVLRATDNGNQSEQVYAYQRGKKGTEARLHGDYSIGFGGHIEEQPTKNKSFLSVVVECAQRELKEEANIDVSEEQLLTAIGRAITFHDCSNAVGRVHLCLAIVLDISVPTITDVETDQVDNIRLMPVERLIDKSQTKDIRLESWTNILLTKVRHEWIAN